MEQLFGGYFGSNYHLNLLSLNYGDGTSIQIRIFPILSLWEEICARSSPDDVQVLTSSEFADLT